MTQDNGPETLGEHGQALWRAVMADHGDALTVAQQAALAEAASTLDLLAALDDAITEHGPVTPAGRPSPLIAEARQQRAILVRLLGLLPTTEAPGATGSGTLARSRSASKAASTRWARSRGVSA